jgi:hypothetical protein
MILGGRPTPPQLLFAQMGPKPAEREIMAAQNSPYLGPSDISLVPWSGAFKPQLKP